jgi:hypothetical protein
MNLMTLWSLLAGLGAEAIIKSFKGSRNWRRGIIWRYGGFAAAVTLLVASYLTTKMLREFAEEDENNIRIAPAVEALRFASQNGLEKTSIVTLEPLLVGMYGSPDVRFADLALLNATTTQALAQENATFLFIEEKIHASDADRDRYSTQLECLARLRRKSLYTGEGYSIIQLFQP